jgi:hypothetical protein
MSELRALATFTFTLTLALTAAARADAQEALKACAGIGDPTARLACYDRLAGVQPASAAPGVSATASPPAVPAPASAAAAPVAAPAELPKESFGLYSAEHPTAPVAASSVTDNVVAVGASHSGRMTVTLGGGGLWELLDGDDPLLAVGNAVTIRRASFGSYLMETPSRRMHRVHRLH